MPKGNHAVPVLIVLGAIIAFIVVGYFYLHNNNSVIPKHVDVDYVKSFTADDAEVIATQTCNVNTDCLEIDSEPSAVVETSHRYDDPRLDAIRYTVRYTQASEQTSVSYPGRNIQTANRACVSTTYYQSNKTQFYLSPGIWTLGSEPYCTCVQQRCTNTKYGKSNAPVIYNWKPNSSVTNTNVVSGAATTNTSSNTNVSLPVNSSTKTSPTNSSSNVNAAINSNTTTTAAVSPLPKITNVTSSYKDGYVSIFWKTDLSTTNQVQYQRGSDQLTSLRTTENDVATTDGFSHNATIPKWPSNVVMQYAIIACADLAKYRTCLKTCGTPINDTCGRACAAADLNSCSTSPNYTVTMPPSVPPVITNISVSFQSGQAVLSWNTGLEVADAVINWGPTTAYGSMKTNKSFEQGFTIPFPVVSGQLYHYAIRACTPDAKCTTTPDATLTAP